MVRSVQLDQHPHACAALTPRAVPGALPVGLPQLYLRHQLAHGLRVQGDAVQFAELVPGKRRSESGPQLVVHGAESLLDDRWVDLVVGCAPPQLMHDALGAFDSHSGAYSPNLSIRYAQNAGRVRLRRLALQDVPNDVMPVDLAPAHAYDLFHVQNSTVTPDISISAK